MFELLYLNIKNSIVLKVKRKNVISKVNFEVKFRFFNFFFLIIKSEFIVIKFILFKIIKNEMVRLINLLYLKFFKLLVNKENFVL